MKLFPLLFIITIIIALTYLEQYNTILAMLIFAGFVKFVVNSKQYKGVNDFFDTAF